MDNKIKTLKTEALAKRKAKDNRGIKRILINNQYRGFTCNEVDEDAWERACEVRWNEDPVRVTIVYDSK